MNDLNGMDERFELDGDVELNDSWMTSEEESSSLTWDEETVVESHREISNRAWRAYRGRHF